MLTKRWKAALITLASILLIATVVYLAGGRIVLTGGAKPTLQFTRSAEEHAELLARHRESQRAEAPAAPAAAAGSAAAEATRSTRADASTDRPAAATDIPAGSTYWTDFRGPKRDGHYQQQAIRINWSAGPPVPLWKQPVGGGYASFVIARGRAFTIEQRGKQEVVAAYDLPTGRELWTNSWTALFSESMGGDGPRATPTWSDGRVYALGGTGELRCVDERSGQTLWRTNILEDAAAANLPWGMAAAPLIVGGTVVVLPGGAHGQSVVAYDKLTGKRAWSALNDQQAYASPMLATLAGVRQILVFSASRLMGLTLEGGDVLWEYPWKTSNGINAAQPLVVSDNRVFVSSAYGTGAAVIELTAADRGLSVREVWRHNRMKNKFASSVLHDGFIYGLDESILACIDAATGDVRWKGGRYGYGQVILASAHLIVLTEDGDIAVVRATPEAHQELMRFPAIEGKTWNHPALSDGYLLVRNIDEMAAFDVRVAGR